MRLWAEAWTRPGDSAYGRKIAEIPVEQGSGTQGYSGVYPASLSIPKSYARLNEILYTDAVTPSNGVWSTIKIFSDNPLDAAGLPRNIEDSVFEWLPSPLVPAQSKTDGTVEISGSTIDSIVGFARVEPWDWDGSVSFVSTFPDWVYGGRNLLNNPGFETSTCRPEINEIVVTATGGTYTLNDGTDTTTLDWNDNASAIEGQIELSVGAGGLGVDNVNVSGSGTAADPYVIEFVVPCTLAGGLILNPAGLTGGTATLTRSQLGALQPNPWTKSQDVSDGTPNISGEYVSFRVTTVQAHTGTYSLLIDPATIGRRFAGAQQVLSVEPGGIYQASVWVYTASASQEYRLVMRGIDEDLLTLAGGGDALVQVTPTANTWTQLSLTDVQVGNNDQIIFRIANINVSGNPAIFYVDDGEFNEGLPSATVGAMFTDLYLDATVDHLPRVVWDDGTATDTPYLTLDFSATLDSDGAAWISSDVSLTFRPRMTYIQVLEEFVREAGYEWRVIADTVPGYYLLQIFNPGTLGGVQAAGIQGGSTDVSHNARYFVPNATDLVLQGSTQLSARASNAGLIAAFGRIEGSQLDLNVTSLVSALTAASEGVASQVRGAEALVYELADPAIEPLVRYRSGDTINIEDPPIVSGSRRVATINFVFTKSGTKYEVSLGSEALLGQPLVNHQVGVLLKRFQRADELPQGEAAQIFGGGGVPRVVIAAVDASAMSQSKADFIATGTDDGVMVAEAVADLAGEVRFTEGEMQMEARVMVYPDDCYLTGAGLNGSYLIVDDIDTMDWTFAGTGGMRFITVKEIVS